MYYAAAPVSTSIKILTGFMLLCCIALTVAAPFVPYTGIIATLLWLVTLFCFLTAPTGYETSQQGLCIIRRLNRKCFTGIIGVKSLTSQPGVLSIRLFGNGGVFAFTGLFWNKQLGRFRAYGTSGDDRYLVLVTTESGKLVITPAEPDSVIEHAIDHRSGT